MATQYMKDIIQIMDSPNIIRILTIILFIEIRIVGIHKQALKSIIQKKIILMEHQYLKITRGL
jgi:hypothetical protein